MDTTEKLRALARGGDEDHGRLVEHLREHPGHTHEILSALTCGDEATETGAARALVRLASDAPDLLEPFTRRLFRICAGHDRTSVRLALAQTMPLLELGAWQAGRLAFVFESWLDENDSDIKKAAMAALVGLVPQRPSLGPRVRKEIERRAAAGSPTAARYGLELLKQLREF